MRHIFFHVLNDYDLSDGDLGLFMASFGVLAREKTLMRYPAGCRLYIPYDGEGYLYIVQYIW